MERAFTVDEALSLSSAWIWRRFTARRELAPKLLRMIVLLREQPLSHMVQLGNTLHSWREEIATMWRLTRNNEIAESFHTKMEALQRQACGFRNFNNYRLRVKVMCSPGA